MKAITNGSEKQNAWATRIRETAIEEMGELVDLLQSYGSTDASMAAQKIADRMGESSNADWWIENRDCVVLKGVIADIPGTNFMGFRFDLVANHPAGRRRQSGRFMKMIGFAMRDEVQKIAQALRELEEAERLAQ